ncbi:hypothetical protein [Agromyces ramosus]|uniref:Secreted protein n=1 Tax=Agromyces ramosus TaxID=33879 RepID=A0ABU0R985_9MICO|nr:hypothetical protein [Agromyces ramosus]MDQ0894634.1 hypothetical protein [Agromyces ramosus]
MSGQQDKSTTVMSRRRGRRATRRQRAWALLASSASIAIVVLLSGCTFGEHYAIFDREAEPADAPPSDLADQELHGVDVDSLRFATEYEGDRLYLARGTDGMVVCLLVDGPGDDGVSAACSGGGWVAAKGGPGSHEYHVHPDGTPLPTDVYTDLTENISVKTG